MEIQRFFKRINKETIDDFLKDNQEEHLNLEFKTVSKADFSNRDDRKNFAKALLIFPPDLGPNRMLVFFDIISIREGDKNEEKKVYGGTDCLCFTPS